MHTNFKILKSGIPQCQWPTERREFLHFFSPFIDQHLCIIPFILVCYDHWFIILLEFFYVNYVSFIYCSSCYLGYGGMHLCSLWALNNLSCLSLHDLTLFSIKSFFKQSFSIVTANIVTLQNDWNVFSRGVRNDASLVPPIRQTASIFKQPVTVYKTQEGKVKTDFKHGPQEKPKQVWKTSPSYTVEICGMALNIF